jgi:hypothetical protein
VKLPNAVQQVRPWVINRIAPDFRLLDVWALPAEGDREDFLPFLEVMASIDPARGDSAITRFLFWVRFRLGELFGWDKVAARPIPGRTETSLLDRLPAELRGSADQPVIAPAIQQEAATFTPIYRTADEWAAEISNGTVHGVLHVGWVERAPGRYGAQLAIYVMPRGRLGQAYLLLIAPFRHVVVYPALMRQVRRTWEARADANGGPA